MTYSELYEELLRRGFHEDVLDECDIDQLRRLYKTGARRTSEHNFDIKADEDSSLNFIRSFK